MPQSLKDEFGAFLERGILAHEFLRLRCGDCGHDKLVAFSCKRRGFRPRTWRTTSSPPCQGWKQRHGSFLGGFSSLSFLQPSAWGVTAIVLSLAGAMFPVEVPVQYKTTYALPKR